MMMTMVSSNAYIACVREVAMRGRPRQVVVGHLWSPRLGLAHVVQSVRADVCVPSTLHTMLASSTYL